jgi:hypothetical protein
MALVNPNPDGPLLNAEPKTGQPSSREGDALLELWEASNAIADSGIAEKDCRLSLPARVGNVVDEMKAWRHAYGSERVRASRVENLLRDLESRLIEQINNCCAERAGKISCDAYGCGTVASYLASVKQAILSLSPRRFQCERCGGTGHEVWGDDPATHNMGQCRDCNGEGLLGEMPELPKVEMRDSDGRLVDGGNYEFVDSENDQLLQQFPGILAGLRERVRQVRKGFTVKHDAEHRNAELAAAAALYACPDQLRLYEMNTAANSSHCLVPHGWPFEKDAWKPSHFNRKRELEKAIAFAAAEWERLDRAERADDVG